jgi:hypothetical protein
VSCKRESRDNKREEEICEEKMWAACQLVTFIRNLNCPRFFSFSICDLGLQKKNFSFYMGHCKIDESFCEKRKFFFAKDLWLDFIGISVLKLE